MILRPALAFSLAMIFSVSVRAETLGELYANLVGQMTGAAWGAYQIKLLQILDSYDPNTDVGGQILSYSSSAKNNCFKTDKLREVYQMYSSESVTENNVDQTLVHRGCYGEILKEVFHADGTEPKPISAVELFTGQRQYLAGEKETQRTYTLYNDHGQVLFSTRDHKDGETRTFQLFIKERLVFALFLTSTQMAFEIRDYEASWKLFRTDSFNWRWSGGAGVRYMYPDKFGVRYIGKGGQDISLNEFKLIISSLVIPRLQSVKQYLNIVDKYMTPVSSFERSGSSNDRLIEQLRKIIQDLRADRDVQPIINTILSIVDSLEIGEIKDLRTDK